MLELSKIKQVVYCFWGYYGGRKEWLEDCASRFSLSGIADRNGTLVIAGLAQSGWFRVPCDISNIHLYMCLYTIGRTLWLELSFHEEGSNELIIYKYRKQQSL